ncbi:MAG TPA: hypothetical protein VH024_02130 [Candidatus Angelobacter sp.]|jgi:hypothetical protein|nr:hypothetical protein [Candidatus Angelobacter sp.]
MFPAFAKHPLTGLEQRFLRRCPLLGKNHVVPRWIFHAAFARTMGCANVRGVKDERNARFRGQRWMTADKN